MGDNLDFNILHLPKNNDKAYRDAACMAYICAVMDLPASNFQTQVKPSVDENKNGEYIIDLVMHDLEIRMRRLLGI